MKKYISKVILGLLAFVLTASYAHAQLTFGARAGLNLTNISQSWDGEKPDKEDRSKIKAGFQIGVVADYALSDVLSIQPGLIFAQQGAKYEDEEDGDKYKEVMNLNYLQIPINFQYKLDLGGANLLLQAGPYLGYGINGKYKFWEDGKRIPEKDLKDPDYDDGDWWKIEFGGDKEKHDLKALDFGIGLGVGLQFDNIQIGLGYNLGLMNLYHDYGSDFKGSLKNNGLALTATFLFGN